MLHDLKSKILISRVSPNNRKPTTVGTGVWGTALTEKKSLRVSPKNFFRRKHNKYIIFSFMRYNI